jgi:hypothetical protein
VSAAPFLEDTPELLDAMLDHIVRARATHPTFAAELDLVDEQGAVRFDYDETRAPRLQGTLVCVMPATQAEVDRLDPRMGVRVELDCGYLRQGGTEDVATIMDVGLRRVRLNYADNTMTLTVAGDEAMVADAAASATSKVNTATHAAGIQQLLGEAIAPAPVLSASVTGGAVTVDPVPDRWTAIQDLADRLEAAVYDDGLRNWFLKPVPTLASTPDLELRTGEGGTVLVPEAELSREAWWNYVQLVYKWRNSSGAEQQLTSTAYVSAGPYAISGDAGKRILLDERRVQTTQAVANAASAAVLRRQLTRSRSFTFQAIAAYWVRPGMTARVTLPGGKAELHLVSRVTFTPLAGTMTVDTRLPDPPADQVISTSTPPPAVPTDPSPAPTPDPTPPAKVKYVSEWVASASQAYRSNGQKNTVIPDRMAQGYNPGSVNGNQQSLAVFTSANSTPAPGATGETGKTISQALTGATIARVQVQLVPTHFWSSQGGTLRVGWASVTSIPATFTGAAVKVNLTNCRENTARWADLTSSQLATELAAGRCRAITIGPGIGTSTTYYALVAGATFATAAWRPRLRITYYK